jgi:hypothetical protein
MISNADYLKQFLELKEGTEKFNRCLTMMESYGENRWWLSNDPRARAYFQSHALFNGGLGILPIESYLADLSQLLGRVVTIEQTHAGDVSWEEIAWCYDSGGTSEEYITFQLKQLQKTFEQREKETGGIFFIGDPRIQSEIRGTGATPPPQFRRGDKDLQEE